MLADLKRMYRREIDSLLAELAAYPDDTALWAAPPGVTNSGGNLLLHLAGNLQHFIGAVLGKSGYVRQRDLEFSSRNVPRIEIKAKLEAARDVVLRTLDTFPADRLGEPFPIEVANIRPPIGMFLIHLLGHLGYHLGQLDYHRRLVTGQNVIVSALAVGKLADA